MRHYDNECEDEPANSPVIKIDVEALITAIKGSTVDAIATDHAPHATHEKELEFTCGSKWYHGFGNVVGLAMTHLVHTGI